MRIQVPIVVEMTAQQVAGWAADGGLPGPVRAKDMVVSVQQFVVETVDRAFVAEAIARAFAGGPGDLGAPEVSIKR